MIIMLWGIIGFILALFGVFLVISLYVNVEETDFIGGCCGGIPIAIAMYLYITMNNNGRLLILAIIYGIYFISLMFKNPGEISNIFDTITDILSEIILGISNLFNKNDNNLGDYPYSNDTLEYPEEYKELHKQYHKVKYNNSQSNNKKLEKKESRKNKNRQNQKSNKSKDKSHYYSGLLDINKATREELENTEGITKITAQKILNLRKEGKYITSS